MTLFFYDYSRNCFCSYLFTVSILIKNLIDLNHHKNLRSYLKHNIILGVYSKSIIPDLKM